MQSVITAAERRRPRFSPPGERRQPRSELTEEQQTWDCTERGGRGMRTRQGRVKRSQPQERATRRLVDEYGVLKEQRS